MIITSKDNPKVKLMRALRQRKQRQESGLFLVEGIRPVGEAAAASMTGDHHPQLDFIFYSPELLTSDFALRLIDEQSERGIPCYELPGALFETLAEKENPQGILAAVREHWSDLAELSPQNFPWVVALVSPQDPGNIGTILRTIDAVGASGLVLLDSSADPFSAASVRASMGAIFWYPLVRASFSDFLVWARQNEYTLYGTSAHGAQDYRSIKKYEFPLVLLMGSEREGLTPEQRQACNQLVQMPMKGRVTSLNLAVATGVMLYDILEKSQPAA
jgi:TrmH family RNA methyltransferase